MEKYPEANNLIHTTHLPVIVVVNDVPIDSLIGENGDDIKEIMEDIKDTAKSTSWEFAKYVYGRFELLKPILPSKLTFSYINNC